MSTLKKVRQIDIARMAGVHQTAVSAVLSGSNHRTTIRVPDDKADLIRKIAKQMGYKPNFSALQLRGQKSKVIGMLMSAPGPLYASERQTRLVVMEQTAYKAGYRMIIGHLINPDQVGSYVEDFTQRGVDGILCLRHETVNNSDTIIKQLCSFPNVVFLGKPVGIPDAFYVAMDHRDGVLQSTEYLIATGRKKIGIALPGLSYSPIRERFEGYRQGLANHGFEFRNENVWVGPEQVTPTPEFMESIYQKLVMSSKIDAIIASNDEWAVTLINYLGEKGIRVPDDIGIIGYDNMSIAGVVRPKLTSIDSCDEIVGQKMIEMLLKIIEEGANSITGDQRSIIVKPRLILRGSA